MCSSRYAALVSRWEAAIARLSHDLRALAPRKSERPLVRGLGLEEGPE